MLLKARQEETVTPEEVIDPISYVLLVLSKEIMKKPFILPSGSSYEEASLVGHFKTNGCKDPISRLPINQMLVFPNLALGRYIREHPKLKQWEQYEYDFIHD